MHISTRALAMGIVFSIAGVPAQALSLRVGTGAGCDHATLQSALNVVRTQGGTHTIRINKGAYPVPDGMIYSPTVAQTAVFLEGGYDSCAAAVPTGDPLTDADRAVFNGSGGIARSVLELRLFGRVGTFQLRRLVLTGGDAFNGAFPELNAGGGMAIRGPASVLLGLGMALRSNGAGYGGGVALIGGPVHTGTVVDKVDLFIDEGASISSNSATENGGGIYCGGATLPTETIDDRHGSIVFLDGTILGNSAKFGAALYCLGSVEGGGGFQPRPRTDRAAWILANNETPPFFGCAAGVATLDHALPADSGGVRTLGADAGSNGLLAITNHVGLRPALCLQGSFSLGTTVVPAGQSKFRLNNFYMSDQGGNDVLGLNLEHNLELEIRPSGSAVACSFFNATPCVTLRNNQFDSATPPSPTYAPLLRTNSGAQLTLTRALISNNRTRSVLMDAFVNAGVRLDASVIDNNQIDANSGFPGLGTQLARSGSGGKVRLNHSTVQFASPIDRFFRLENTGTAAVLASILTSSAAAAPANIGGDAPASSFTREWCGYFRRTDDLAGTTVIADPTLGGFSTSTGAIVIDPVTFTPSSPILIDKCSVSSIPDRDFYGYLFGQQSFPLSTTLSDLGAVEVQPVPLPDALFSNGFE